MAVSPPPRKNTPVAPESPVRKTDDKKIDAIINRGSSSVGSNAAELPQIKNFNIKITSDVLARIDEVRAMRPRKPASPKLGISTQDWLLEAIAEKLEREQRKHK
jgi:hypothetical protein